MARKREERAAKVNTHKKDKKSKSAKVSEDEHNLALFNTQLASMGLVLREVPGDGNCLFRALGDQLEGHTRKHLQHRQDTVEYMRLNRMDFEPFIEDNVSFDSYVNNLEKPGTYAGNDAIVAFARQHMVTVVIHQVNSPLWKVHGGEHATRELHIGYHNGDHYNSIRRIGDTTENPANIKLGADVQSLPSTESPHFYTNPVYQDDYDESDSEDDEDLVQQVMKRSGCTDRTLAEQILEEQYFDIECAVDVLINVLVVSREEAEAKVAANHSLWGPQGTGTRVFGSDSELILGSTSNGGGAKQKFPKTLPQQSIQPKKHMSNRQRKEMKRHERKMNSDLRKKQAEVNKTLDDSTSALGQKLACVNI